MSGRATVLYKANGNTTHSCGHLSIPVKFINRALEKSLRFKEDLWIVAEIVPDAEFEGTGTTTVGIRYRVSYEGDRPHMTMPESDRQGFTGACVAALADIHVWKGSERMTQEKARNILELALRAEFDAVPAPQPPQRPKLEEERQVTFRPAGSGVKVVCFALVVKTASIAERYPGGLPGFLAAFPETKWEGDGMLLRTSAMATEDLAPIIESLIANNLQAKASPADFYVLEDFLSSPVSFLTHDDNELESVREEQGLFVYLRNSTVRPDELPDLRWPPRDYSTASEPKGRKQS